MEQTATEFTGVASRELSRMIGSWYADAPAMIRKMQSLRPYICPFSALVTEVPPQSRLLDIGCGAGLFVALLAQSGRLAEAVGWDVNPVAIRAAQQMQTRLGHQPPVPMQFIAGQPEDELPAGEFDVVSMIDVLHHVPVVAQEAAIRAAARKVRQGGLLIFKDIGERPRWRAAANRLHDLLVAREWIHYCPIDRVTLWVEDCGLRLTRSASEYLFWYHHELRCFRRD